MSLRSAVIQHTPRKVLLTVDRHPRMKRLLRRAGSRSVPTGMKEVVLPTGPCKGARMTLDFTYNERYLWLGTYEPWVAATLPRVLPQGAVLWDIGANIGYYILFASRCSAVRHLAVEADPTNLQRLRRHLADNRVDAEVLGVAVTSTRGTARFDVRANPALSRVSAECGVEVPTMALDDLLEGRPEPSVVMMDIEGAEHAALLGAEELLWRVRPSWLVELHGEQGLRAHDVLVDAGYQIRVSNERSPVRKQLTTHRVHILAVPD